MPINPNIAMGFQGVQLTNPLDAYAKMSQIQGAQNQNALAQYQLAQAQRQDTERNALNEAWGQYDPGTGDTAPMLNKLRERGAASAIPEVMKKIQESETAKTTAQKSKLELVDAKWKNARSYLDYIDPASPNAGKQILNWTMANFTDPITGPELKARLAPIAQQQGMTVEQFMPQYLQQREAEINAAVAQGPQAVDALLLRSKVGVEKFMEMNKPVQIAQDTGDGGRVLTRPGLGGPATVVEGSEFTKKLSAKDKADLAVQQQRLALQRQQFEREGDPEYIRKVEEAKALGKIAPKSNAKTESASQVLTLLESVDKPDASGKSTLDRATGSGAGALYDKLTDFFGYSTTGADAISDLKVISGKLVLRGERLGGATSDADRKFYIESAGSLADPSVPADRKRAALKRMRQIEKDAGGVVKSTGKETDLGDGFFQVE